MHRATTPRGGRASGGSSLGRTARAGSPGPAGAAGPLGPLGRVGLVGLVTASLVAAGASALPDLRVQDLTLVDGTTLRATVTNAADATNATFTVAFAPAQPLGGALGGSVCFAGGADGDYDAGDPVYYAPAGCAQGAAGAVRLTPAGGRPHGTHVGPGDADAGDPLTTAALPTSPVRFADHDGNGRWSAGDAAYLKLVATNLTAPGDLRLTPAGGQAAGTVVKPGSPDLATFLVAPAGAAWRPAGWRWHDAAPPGFGAGDPVYVDVDGDAHGTALDVRIAPSPLAALGQGVVKGLGAGAAAALDIPWTPPGGSWAVHAMADAGNAVREGREDDNGRTLQVAMPAPAGPPPAPAPPPAPPQAEPSPQAAPPPAPALPPGPSPAPSAAVPPAPTPAPPPAGPPEGLEGLVPPVEDLAAEAERTIRDHSDAAMRSAADAADELASLLASAAPFAVAAAVVLGAAYAAYHLWSSGAGRGAGRTPRPGGAPRAESGPAPPEAGAGPPAAATPPPPPPRFVNLAVEAADGRLLARTSALAAGQGYALRVDIGDPDPNSVVQDPGAHAFPSERLPEEAGGHWLEVGLASDDFELSARLHRLFLPRRGASWVCDCPPGQAHRCRPGERRRHLRIPVRAPRRSGQATLRMAIYFRNNLVQSQLLTAEVADTEGPGGRGHASVVDFTLTADLRGLAALPPRALNILTNHKPDGSHRIMVKGPDGEGPASFTLGEQEVGEAMRRARAALVAMHRERGAGGAWVSRLGHDNGKDPEAFLEDLRALAPLGWKLWDALFSGHPDKDRLHDGPLARPATIQVERLGARGLVFPWTLVYDIPVVHGAALTPCPWFEEWKLARAAGRAPPPCGRDHRSNVLCPYGFWGFKHTVELLATTRGKPLPRCVARARPRARMVVGLSTALAERFRDAHLDRLRGELPGVEVVAHATKAAFGEALDEEALELVYCYVHGAREPQPPPAPPGDPLLVLGADEELSPTDLSAWERDRWARREPRTHWRTTRPLVFINGCHTVELNPQELSNFVDGFLNVWAAAVVGTEVAVTQRVANEAAEEVLLAYARGERLGACLQRLRQGWLHKGNLLGLAYTAYGSVDLRLGAPGEAACARENEVGPHG